MYVSANPEGRETPSGRERGPDCLSSRGFGARAGRFARGPAVPGLSRDRSPDARVPSPLPDGPDLIPAPPGVGAGRGGLGASRGPPCFPFFLSLPPVFGRRSFRGFRPLPGPRRVRPHGPKDRRRSLSTHDTKTKHQQKKKKKERLFFKVSTLSRSTAAKSPAPEPMLRC